MINYERFANLLSEADKFFSESYSESRTRWLTAVDKKDAQTDSILVEGPGSQNEALYLDFATIGGPKSEKILFHVSGTHGIEGYLGAAIQLAILDCLEPSDNITFVFLHCLNPWGMSHKRRVTKENIDLNRNFHLDQSKFKGAPNAYRALDSFLNPKRGPLRVDAFLLQTILAIIRYGYSPVKQAIAGGQHEYEKGLFYGGKSISGNLVFLEKWIRENLSSAKKILGLEVHSGLGPFGYDTLISQLLPTDPKIPNLEKTLAHKISTDDPKESVAFRTSGDVASAVPEIITKLSGSQCDWILQEFGTYNIIKMLSAFRDENMHYHHGCSDLNHWSKKNLFEAFNPANRRWRQFVVGRGMDLFAKGISWLD